MQDFPEIPAAKLMIREPRGRERLAVDDFAKTGLRALQVEREEAEDNALEAPNLPAINLAEGMGVKGFSAEEGEVTGEQMRTGRVWMARHNEGRLTQFAGVGVCSQVSGLV